ncbi:MULTISPECIES: BBE domain-containing protein [Paenibacillus]
MNPSRWGRIEYCRLHLINQEYDPLHVFRFPQSFR